MCVCVCMYMSIAFVEQLICALKMICGGRFFLETSLYIVKFVAGDFLLRSLYMNIL